MQIVFSDNFQTFLEKLVEIFVGDKMIKNPFEAGKLRQWGLGGIQSGRGKRSSDGEIRLDRKIILLLHLISFYICVSQ